jgi:glycerophosphoryl diester phosphodiesterase
MRRPSIIAHRGASGYEYENSRAAFRRAVMLDADGVELDVHATRDGALLVHHDAELPGLGPIARLALAECAGARLRNGETVPQLGEVLELLAGLDVWIEVKTLAPSNDPALFAALDAGPEPGRYAVHAFDHRIVRRLCRARPSLPVGALMASYLIDCVAPLRDAGATTLWQEAHLIDQELVDRVHDAGLRIVAWTVNDPGEAARLAQLGVDGLCGNFPDRLRVASAPAADLDF